MFDNDSDFANLWDNTAAAPSSGFSSLPDGNYEAVVHSVRFEKTKTGKNMIAWDLIVNAGEYKGRHVFNNQVLATAQGISYAKAQFSRLGFDCSSFENVHLAFEQLIDKIVAITLKTSKGSPDKDPRQNVYVNKIIRAVEVSPDPTLWK